jgi:hypothetical protein
VERIFRDLRLSSIWTGTNEVMAMIIATEWYREHAATRKAAATRDVEQDAREAGQGEEKVFE